MSFLFILVWESLNPVASSKTDSKEQNSFCPSTALPLLYTSVKTGCLAWNSWLRNSWSDAKILGRWIKELFPTTLTDIALYEQLSPVKDLNKGSYVTYG